MRLSCNLKTSAWSGYSSICQRHNKKLSVHYFISLCRWVISESLNTCTNHFSLKKIQTNQLLLCRKSKSKISFQSSFAKLIPFSQYYHKAAQTKTSALFLMIEQVRKSMQMVFSFNLHYHM